MARKPVHGAHFAAATGHSLASLAAVETFRRSGNVVDAAIAASAVTSVVLQHAAGIGGDAFILYREGRTGRTFGLNASGVAPALATADAFARGMEQRGPLASVVPGLVAGWETLHRRFGKLPWRRLFEPAVEAALASAASDVAAERAAAEAADLRADPGCASIYLPGGQPLARGAVLRQPALAATMRQIAAYGAEGFYRGAVADRIGAFFEGRGGLLRASDLAGYRTIWVDPIATEYRGYRVQVMPPNSCGVLLLMQLDGLSAIDSARLRDDDAFRVACQMHAMRAAFAEGASRIADMAVAPDLAAQLLAPEMKARMQAAVLRGTKAPHTADSGGTSCLVFADADGNAVSLVQSVFNVFGAMLLDPDTGILFNNRMHGFTNDPRKPNVVAPGKRPAHTLCPVMVERGGEFRFAMATPGGLSQTLTNVQVLSHLVDCGMDVQQAVESPRWCNTRTGDFLIERSFPEQFVSTLAQFGHRAARKDDGYFYGSAKAVERLETGVLSAGADFRREAFALSC